jgi:2,4-diketo-3-deoxy-L-fuconate hydrolase
MRLANLGGRATLVVPEGNDRGVDIAKVSGGQFGPEVQGLYEEWDAVLDFVTDLDLSTVATAKLDEGELRASWCRLRRS